MIIIPNSPIRIERIGNRFLMLVSAEHPHQRPGAPIEHFHMMVVGIGYEAILVLDCQATRSVELIIPDVWHVASSTCTEGGQVGPRLVVEHHDPPKESMDPDRAGAGDFFIHPVMITTQNEQPIAGAGEVHGKESIILMPRFVEVPKVNRQDGLADLGRAEGHAD
tara:strand:- start:31 stop:525 length:495 start_codon:yes stop_codon:yes gene_type:complete